MSETPATPGTPETPPSGTPQAGIADAFSQLSEQTAALVRQEIESARAEVVAKAKGAVAGGALLGAAATAGVFAGASLHTWFVRVLGKWLPPAWAAFVATLFYGGVAGALGTYGLQRLRAARAPYPSATIRRATQDVREAVAPGQ
jgi:hypothetical protein